MTYQHGAYVPTGAQAIQLSAALKKARKEREARGMFDSLTADERRELANLLINSARDTFTVAHTFATVCLKTLEPDSPTEVSVWGVRCRFIDMREEICAVIDDLAVN